MIWKYVVKCKPKICISDFDLIVSLGEKENLSIFTPNSHIETGTPYKYGAEWFESLGEISYFKTEFWFKCKLEVVMKNIRGNWKDP